MGGEKCGVGMWMGQHLCVCLGEVSTYKRLEIQCLYEAGTMNVCPLRRDVRLWEVTVCRHPTVCFCAAVSLSVF